MDYLLGLLPGMLSGLWIVIKLFVLTLAFSLPLGLPVALGSLSRVAPIRYVSRAYVWLFRGTPLLLQLYFFYFAMPLIIPALTFDRFPTAVIAFVLNYAAYFSEIYRAGIQSIDKGQYEAAKSLGYTRWQTMRLIIIPQMIRRIIPPVSNETITLVKDTSLITAIAIPELLKSARDAVNRDGNATAFIVAAVPYLVITFGLTVLANYLERRYSRHEEEV